MVGHIPYVDRLSNLYAWTFKGQVPPEWEDLRPLGVLMPFGKRNPWTVNDQGSLCYYADILFKAWPRVVDEPRQSQGRLESGVLNLDRMYKAWFNTDPDDSHVCYLKLSQKLTNCMFERIRAQYPDWKFFRDEGRRSDELSVDLRKVIQRKAVMLANRSGRIFPNVPASQLSQETCNLVKDFVPMERELSEPLDYEHLWYLNLKLDEADRARALKDVAARDVQTPGVLMDSFKNLYTRLFKLDSVLPCRLDKPFDWNLRSGPDSFVRNVDKLRAVYNRIYVFVSDAIRYLDEHLDSSIKGDFHPVLGSDLREVDVTTANAPDLMARLPQEVERLKEAVASVETALIFMKKRTLTAELPVEVLASDIAQVARRAEDVRKALVAKGARISRIVVPEMPPPTRAFEWVGPTVSALKTSWSVLSMGIGALVSVGKTVVEGIRTVKAEFIDVDDDESVESVVQKLRENLAIANTTLDDLQARVAGRTRDVEFTHPAHTLTHYLASASWLQTGRPEHASVSVLEPVKLWHSDLMRIRVQSAVKDGWDYYVPYDPACPFTVGLYSNDWRAWWASRSRYAFCLIEQMWANLGSHPAFKALPQASGGEDLNHLKGRVALLEAYVGPAPEVEGRTFPSLVQGLFPGLAALRERIRVLEVHEAEDRGSGRELMGLIRDLQTTVNTMSGRMSALETAGGSQSSGVSAAALAQITASLNELTKWRNDALLQMATHVKVDQLAEVRAALGVVQSTLATISVPADLAQQVAALKARVDTLSKAGSQDLESQLGEMGERLHSLESRVGAVEQRYSLSVQDRNLLGRLHSEYVHLVGKVSALMKTVNDWGTAKAFEPFTPFSDTLAQNGVYTGQLYDDMVLAFLSGTSAAIACLQWYVPQLEGRDAVLVKRWLRELEHGSDPTYTNIYMLEILRHVKVCGQEVVRNPVALCQELGCKLARKIDTSAGNKVCTDGVQECRSENAPVTLGLVSGTVPCKRELSEALGYHVGKGRMWLSWAEWARVHNHALADRWQPHVHPSAHYAGPQDKHLQEEQSSKGQNNPRPPGVAVEPARSAGVGDTHAERVPDVQQDVEVEVEEVYDFQDFSEDMFTNVHPAKCVVTGGRSTIDMNVAPGAVLMSWRLRDIAKAKGPFAGMIHTMGRVAGALALSFKLKVSPLCGIALMAVFLEAGFKAGTVFLDIVKMFAHPHRLWNPACEDSVVFPFQPLSCDTSWHPDFLAGHEGAVVVLAATGWVTPPTSLVHYTWNLAYTRERFAEQTVLASGDAVLNYRSYLGSLEFQPNTLAPHRRVELNVGKPVLTGAGYLYSFWESYVGQFQYWKADLEFEITRASGPMVAATIGFTVLPGRRAMRTDPEFLQSVPHCEFTFDPNSSVKRIRVPKHMVAWNGPSDRNEIGYTLSAQPAFTVVVWLLDDPTSAGNSPLVLLVSIARMSKAEFHGHSGGYPMSYVRAKAVPFPDVQVSYLAFESMELEEGKQTLLPYQRAVVPDSAGQSAARWNHCFTLLPAVGPQESYLLMDAHRPYVHMYKRKVSSGSVVYSPFVRMLHSCQWIKGTLIYRLVWACKDGVKMADWAGSLRVSVYTDTLLSLRTHHFVSHARCGEHEFAVDVGGPVNGFSQQEGLFEFHKPHAQIYIEMLDRLKQFEYCEGYVSPDDGFRLCGVSSSVMIKPTTGFSAGVDPFLSL